MGGPARYPLPVQRRHFIALFVLIGVIDAVIIGGLVGATAGPAIGIPVGLAVGFAPLVALPLFAGSGVRMSGLAALAQRFPMTDAANAEPRAPTRGLCTVSFRTRATRLNNCVQAWADDDHLHLRLVFPMVKPQPGISIPWSAVESITMHKRDAELRLFDGPPMWVPPSVAAVELRVREAIESEGPGQPA